MSKFSDYLLNPNSSQEEKELAQIKLLKSLVDDQSLTQKAALAAALSLGGELPIGVSLNPGGRDWVSLTSHSNISFSFVMLDPLANADGLFSVQALEGPVIKELDSFSEIGVLEASLQGFSGYSFPPVPGDLASTQFGVEFGRDYGMDAVLAVNNDQVACEAQYLECEFLKLSPDLNMECLDMIPNTRRLIFEIESLEDLDRIGGRFSSAAFLLNQDLLGSTL